MNIDKKYSWFEKTNQMWKVRLFVILIIGELILILLLVWSNINPQNNLFGLKEENNIFLDSGSLLLGLVAITVLFYLVKCPLCKKKPVYYIISNSNVNEWFSALRNLEHCPYCNDEE